MKLHEYQNKGLTGKAFRNCLILKGEDRGCSGPARGNDGAKTEKREQAPALQT
jgi:hypothetical protein